MAHERKPIAPAQRARIIFSKMIAAARGDLGPATPNPVAAILEAAAADNRLRITPTPTEALPYRVTIERGASADSIRAAMNAIDQLPTAAAPADLEPHLYHFREGSALRPLLRSLPVVLDPTSGALIGANDEVLKNAAEALSARTEQLRIRDANVVYAQQALRTDLNAIVRTDPERYVLVANPVDRERASQMIAATSTVPAKRLEQLAGLHARRFGEDAAQNMGGYAIDDLMKLPQEDRSAAIVKRLAERNIDRATFDVILSAAQAQATAAEQARVTQQLAAEIVSSPELYSDLMERLNEKVPSFRRLQGIARIEALTPESSRVMGSGGRDDRTRLSATLAEELQQLPPDGRRLVSTAVHRASQEREANTEREQFAQAITNGLHVSIGIARRPTLEWSRNLLEKIAPEKYRDLAHILRNELKRESKSLLFQADRYAAQKPRARTQRTGAEVSPEAALAAKYRASLADTRDRETQQARGDAALEQFEQSLYPDPRPERAVAREEARRDPLHLNRMVLFQQADRAPTRLEAGILRDHAELLRNALDAKYELGDESIGAPTALAEGKASVWEAGRYGALLHNEKRELSYLRYDRILGVTEPGFYRHRIDGATIEMLARTGAALNVSIDDKQNCILSLDQTLEQIRQDHSNALAVNAIDQAANLGKEATAGELMDIMVAADQNILRAGLRKPQLFPQGLYPARSDQHTSFNGPVIATNASWAIQLDRGRKVLHELSAVPQVQLGDHLSASYVDGHIAKAEIIAEKRHLAFAALDIREVGLDRNEQTLLRSLTHEAAQQRGIELSAHERPKEACVRLGTVIARTVNGASIAFDDGSAVMLSNSRIGALPAVNSTLNVLDGPEGVQVLGDASKVAPALDNIPAGLEEQAFTTASLVAISKKFDVELAQLRPLDTHSVIDARMDVLLATTADTYFGMRQGKELHYLKLPTFSVHYGQHPLQRDDYDRATKLAAWSELPVAAHHELARAQAEFFTKNPELQKELDSLLVSGGAMSQQGSTNGHAGAKRVERSAPAIAPDLREAIARGGARFSFNDGYVTSMEATEGARRGSLIPIVHQSLYATIPMPGIGTQSLYGPRQAVRAMAPGVYTGNALAQHEHGLYVTTEPITANTERISVSLLTRDELFGEQTPTVEPGAIVTMELGPNGAVVSAPAEIAAQEQSLALTELSR